MPLLTAKEFAAQVGVTASTVRRIIKDLEIEHAKMDYKSVTGGRPEWVTRTRLFTEESLLPVQEKILENRENTKKRYASFFQRREARSEDFPTWHERLGTVL